MKNNLKIYIKKLTLINNIDKKNIGQKLLIICGKI